MNTEYIFDDASHIFFFIFDAFWGMCGIPMRIQPGALC